ncbi:hypothetical protein N2152v2_009023 [Parachlorella kessleri]
MARGDDEEVSEEYEEASAEALHREKKRPKSAFIDDAAEEDDEEEEGGRRLKRSKFIDDIAEVDDDEEEELEDDDDMHELIDDTGEDIPDAAELMKMRHKAVEMANLEDDINPEQLQKYIDERFGRDKYVPVATGEGEEVGAVSQQLLLPTPADPKLWVVRCGEGQEREAIVCLLQKCYDLANKGQPLLIKSAFCQDHLQGYFYVEAHKEAHVKEALRGLRMIYGSKAPKLVPLKEMVDAVSVPRTAVKPLDAGAWVRVKSGLYKGDLAKVVDVSPGEGKATIRLVPRLDLAAIANRKPEDVRANFGKQPKVRPAARPFNPEEARNHKLDVIQQRDRSTGEVFYLLGSQRFCEGYLQKVVALKSLQPEETLPPLDELQRYNAAAQTEEAGTTDLAGLIQNLQTDGSGVEAALPKFAKGDKVIVIEGDLKNIQGIVEQIQESGDVLVRPNDKLLKDFGDLIPFKPRELSKFFESGNHVKVVHGQHTGETGMVVRVEGPVCYVFTDTTQQEIRVFGRDLTEAAAMASSADTLAGYELHDLVALDNQTFGVIVGVEKEACRVLTNQGRPEKPDVRVCRLPDIQRKLLARRNVTQDAGRNEVNQNDIVDVVDGPLKGKSGTVRHVMRGILFIQSREVHENGGFVCVRATHCKVRGGKRPAGGSGMGIGMTPGRTPGYGGVMASPHPYRQGPGNMLASPARQGAGPPGRGPGGQFGGGPPGGGFSGRVTTQQDKLLEGKVITIKKGPYRGMRGRVITASGTHVRLELEAQMKTVTVDRSHLALEDGGVRPEQQMQQRPQYGMPTATPMHAGGRTPHHPGIMATPMHYNNMMATPMHPGMTPGRDAVTKTPAYDPAWAGATPAHPGMAGTAAGYPQAGTPGYSPSFHADTPGIAPSPGMGAYMHPSPGGVAYSPGIAGTPGGVAYSPGIAPTPGGSTPGLGGAGEPSGSALTSHEHWQDVEVRLPEGEVAVVRELPGDGSAMVQVGSPDEADPDSVVYPPDAPSRSVPLKSCALVAPERRDSIKVLVGDLAGQTGELVGTDGGDGIIKIAGDVKILSLAWIGKYVAAPA